MSCKRFVLWGLCLGGLVAVALSGQTVTMTVSDVRPTSFLPVRFDKWLNKDVPFIITEKERDVFLRLTGEREREIFIESFWKARDPNPATPANEFQAEHYRRLEEADRRFAAPETPGRITDRGRVFILLGEPKEIVKTPGETGSAEAEVWSYEGGAERGRPSNYSVVFSREKDKSEYRLVNPQAGSAFLERCNMKMRVFEGLAEGQAEPTTAVTSSSLKHTMSATLQPDDDLDAQQKRIRDVFNLKSVKLLTETNLVWEKGKLDKAFHFFRIGEKTYLVQVTPTGFILERKFRIEVLEQTNGTKTSLLETEASFPKNISAIFGFRDAQGRAYFVSLHILEWYVEGNAPVPPRAVAAPPPAIPAEGPVRAIGEIRPPRLIKQVDPVYPAIARQARVEGIVILEATTDIYGRVMSLKVLRSIPLLDQAAIDAVRQWVYEPMIIQGNPREIVFTTTVRFTLDDRSMGPQTSISISPGGAPTALKKIKEVQAVYPETALRVNAQGTVVLEGTIDETGKVAAVKVLRSVQPALDRAAENAVKQWAFEPVLEGGKPISVAVIFSVRFWINTSPSAVRGGVSAGTEGGVAGGVVGGIVGGVVGGVVGGTAGGVQGGVTGGISGRAYSKEEIAALAKLPPIRAEGPISPPQIVKQVEPIYPEVARQGRVEGIVILEITTDIYGRVMNLKVLRSIPLLDQAAIEAVKQWVYEPLIIEGKPRGCIFTATVRFTLK